MKLDMQKKSILKILGENDKNIKLRKIWGIVLVNSLSTCLVLKLCNNFFMSVQMYEKITSKKEQLMLHYTKDIKAEGYAVKI